MACAVFCEGPLLAAAQNSGLFNDSKTFVDMPLLADPAAVLAAFNETGTFDQPFLQTYFAAAGSDLEDWTPPDAGSDPSVAALVADSALRQFALDLNALWATLGRRAAIPAAETDRHSLIDTPNGVIVPGGRFRESYYWDTLFIIRGLLVCDMTDTAKGLIENFIFAIDSFGFVPNGMRVYYLTRSQPPVLSEMVVAYAEAADDWAFAVDEALPALETEYAFWMRDDEFSGNLVPSLALNRYTSNTTLPRPESYLEDVATATEAGFSGAQAEAFYHQIAGAAETGWDFSSRWLADGYNLSTAVTNAVLPVDLNSILYRMELNLADLCERAGRADDAEGYATAAEARAQAIEALLWNEGTGQWQDYRTDLQEAASPDTAANWLPLWAGLAAGNETRAEAAVASFKGSGLLQAGGVRETTVETGQQWDSPNAWAPSLLFLLEGVQSTDPDLALDLAQLWVGTTYAAYTEDGVMYEKYDAFEFGHGGGGGEYTPQTGFGWTNGVTLALLASYGSSLSSPFDDDDDSDDSDSDSTLTIVMVAGAAGLVLVLALYVYVGLGRRRADSYESLASSGSVTPGKTPVYRDDVGL